MHIIEAIGGSQGREWDVVLITSGLSKNGNYYPASVLAESAPLFEGCYAFADHATADDRRSRPERSVKDKVGRFSGVTFGQHEVGGHVVEGLRARLKVIAPWLRETLQEAVAMDEPDFLGLSIDAEGRTSRREHGGRAVTWVEALTRVNSVDVVTDPAAGGRIVRLVASNGGQNMDPEELKRLLAEAAQAGAATALAAMREAAPAPAPDPAPPAATVGGMSEADALRIIQEAQAATAAQRRSLLESHLVKSLDAATGLSELGRQHVRKGVTHDLDTGRPLTEADISARVVAQQDFEAAFVQAQPLSLTRQIAMGTSAAEKVHKGLQAWVIGAPVDGIPPFRSLREAYCRWHGIDYFDLNVEDFADSFACEYKGARTHAKLKESLTVGSWGQIFADVLYLRLITEYGQILEIMDWRKIVSDIVPVDDFRTYHYARVGGYADMTSVSEGAPYPALTTPGDEETTFSVAKYGGIDDWTLEAALNDKTNKVRQLPRTMALAAIRTLYKYVLTLVTTTNPTMAYDSTALYDAAHSNTGTTALTISGLNATQVAMRDQSPFGISDEKLGGRNKIRYLIVPNELEERANRIVNPSDGYVYAVATPADTETVMDPATFKGKGIDVIVCDYLTDSTDWWAMADPAMVPTVVMGFLNGRQEPELFLQADPTVGSNFTADKTAAKVRLIYGGAVLEHRSFYRQVVTGS